MIRRIFDQSVISLICLSSPSRTNKNNKTIVKLTHSLIDLSLWRWIVDWLLILADCMFFRPIYQKPFLARPFHTSSPRHVHPLIWVFLKPALKGVAWLTGRWSIGTETKILTQSLSSLSRSARRWFRELPPEKRSIFFEHLKRQKYKYMTIFGTLTGAAGVRNISQPDLIHFLSRWLDPLLHAFTSNSYY